MWVGWVESCCLEFQPVFAAAYGFLTARPIGDHSRKDVWHRPKRGIHKGYDGTAALECFCLLDQDVSRWRLATFAGGPRVGLTILLGQLRDECVDNCGGFLIDRFKNGKVHEGSFDRLIVGAGTVNSE